MSGVIHNYHVGTAQAKKCHDSRWQRLDQVKAR